MMCDVIIRKWRGAPGVLLVDAATGRSGLIFFVTSLADWDDPGVFFKIKKNKKINARWLEEGGGRRAEGGEGRRALLVRRCLAFSAVTASGRRSIGLSVCRSVVCGSLTAMLCSR